jgi:DNA polymerase
MITWKVLKTRVPIERWECTAARAAALALPRALENLCEALKLDTKKNPDGKRLIRKYCQPRKPTFTNTSLWNDDEEGLEALAQYCADDVRAETEVYLTLPPLPPLEKKVWVLDQRINSRGVYCDRPLVKTVLKMVREELAELQRETIELTDGRVENTTKRAECLVWLEEQGLVLPNFQAKTVADAIETGLATGPARKLLEIRQAVSKTSTAKYLAFEKRTRTDSRLRDLLLYHGASTGRWSGVGVQPQNFPRPKIENVPDAIRAVRQGDLEWVRAMHGPPMEVFASCLRGVLRATPGRRLYCADYSAIEARVLFWIAKHDAGLRAFEQDRDLYRELAT